MFGLDETIAGLGGGGLLVALAVALLLGLRHATDPDHLTAVSTLVAADGEVGPRRAGALGLGWGLGHATTLLVFGLPIVLFDDYLPEPVQRGAEVVIGLVIMFLAARLLRRWRHRRTGADRQNGGIGRSPAQAYAIGLVHGIGGSAGVGVLLLAAIPSHVEGVVALAIFALFTAVSMVAASSSFGFVLSRRPVLLNYAAVVPALGALSLAFGAWYALAAVNAVPYYL
jgi:high-affinity nickel permease